MAESPWSPSGAASEHIPTYAHGQPALPPWPPAGPRPPAPWGYPPAPAPRRRNGWLIACLVSVTVFISLGFIAPFAFAAYLTHHAEESLDTVTGRNTDDILADNLDVGIGDYIQRRGHANDGGQLDLTLTNKGQQRATFDVTLEAVNDHGNRIAEINAVADGLAAGQSFTQRVWAIPDDAHTGEELQHATFRVLSVTMR